MTPLRLFACITALACLCLAAQSAQARTMEDMNTIVMRTIDKLSARTHTFDIPVGKTVKFGNSLFIKVQSCRKSSPLDRPESAAFMQIWERKPTEEKSQWVFSGWMFSSNPSVSAMDHPVYDVWVIECKNASTSKKSSEEFSEEKAPEEKPEQSEDAAPAPETSSGTGGVATPEPAPAPAAEKPAVPALEQLPGSFESGGSEN